ncbi:MAG TPA: hypothetical protein VMR70_18855 [Flavisolibacter sp.]|nr:hypothetical protein [Flavisolibacter sp.]
MKKYLLGFFAVVMALSLSAFNLPAKKQKSASLSTFQYWQFNPSTNTLGNYVGELDPVTDQAELEDLTCIDDGNIQCARGYDSQFGPSNKPEGSEVSMYQDIVAHD